VKLGATCEKDPKQKKPTFQGFLPLEKKISDDKKNQSRKVILLAGPTGCGKTALSLMLAEALCGEIISADSMQVYQGMDIGTAKVSFQDRERIPHHLIDIRHLQENFNVVDFYYEARQCCESILARGKVPIIVGGSGFYFRALLYGPPNGPPSIPEVRQQLEEEMKEKGSEVLFDRLKDLDPAYASTITNRDRHKIVRALEIITLTGEKVSKLSWKRDKTTLDYDFRCWFLYRPREILYKRIEERCEQMIKEGFLEEVKALENQGLCSNVSASQAIGYRQCLDYLQTAQTPQDFERFLHMFKTASRQYAKRQFTWFRKEPLFRWLNVEVHDFEIAMDMIIQDFER
jgi:tRNA dimethylallyltransferase